MPARITARRHGWQRKSSRYDLAKRKGLARRASLVLAHSLMELGDVDSAGAALAHLHGQKLTMSERRQLLPILLRWQMAEGKYAEAVAKHRREGSPGGAAGQRAGVPGARAAGGGDRLPGNARRIAIPFAASRFALQSQGAGRGLPVRGALSGAVAGPADRRTNDRRRENHICPCSRCGCLTIGRRGDGNHGRTCMPR